MLTPSAAAAELLARRKARAELGAYIRYTSPKYTESGFSSAVCAALDKFIDDVQAGRRPVLILQAPPQHGKSEIVSRKLPAYLLGRFPDWRIAAASYSSGLAGAMSLDVRRNLVEPEHLRLFPVPTERRKYAVDRNGEFSSPSGSGGYIGDGILGGFTGRASDCMVAGTMVDTDCGKIRIEDLEIAGSSVKILACKNGVLSYERIEAFAVRSSVGIYRVTSELGRVFEATGDHPVYSGGRYVKTNELAPGDDLLCAVLDGDNATGVRCAKEVGERSNSHILFAHLRRAAQGFRTTLRALRHAFESGNVRTVLRRMPAFWTVAQRLSAGRGSVSDVSKRIYRTASGEWKVCGILFNRMCQPGALSAYVGRRQSEMEEWRDSSSGTAALRPSVPRSQTFGFASRWARLRSLWRNEMSTGSASHRRLANEQRIVKFGDAVRPLPQRCAQADGWKIEADRVVSVERVREEAVTYDIQVEGAQNFFANGVLVHNCFIIDDPIKNSQEALSPTTKETHWNWYQTVCKTRLSANSGQIIMATSWAEDDLPGRIMALHAGDPRLTVLRFPAINEPGEAGFNPELPRGPLVPELHPLEQLLEFKAEMSDYWWSAIYQQSPKALGGNVFKEHGLRYYLPKDLPTKFDKVIASWDCTFKDTDGTDFVVGQVWGKVGANSYLLAQVRARMSFTKTVSEVVLLRNAWPRTREVLIEDKANGPAVIDTLKASVPGIIPIEPDGSKLARAHAVTSYWEAGNVWLPHPDLFPWVKDLVNELTGFPAAANDDQVDALTQALRRLYPLFNRIKISAATLNKAMGR